MTDAQQRSGLPLEILAVWVLFLGIAMEILVTYWRLPAGELYQVSGTGLSGGTGRVLVFSNYPVALIAIGILALLFERLTNRATQIAAVAGVVLCAAVAWPGVVDQADLDARAVNALAGIGVLLAIVLTAVTARGGASSSGRQPGDYLRVAVAAVALFIGLPWMAADLGFFLDGVPGLGDLFQTGVHPHGAPLPAVHHGHHHGMVGVESLLCAALLSRVVPSLRDSRLRKAAGLYVALMASYGIALIANDFWGEQIVKRGSATWQFPDVIRPGLTIAWGLIAIGAVAIYALAVLWRRRTADDRIALNPVPDL